jgi:hypothetical protein
MLRLATILFLPAVALAASAASGDTAKVRIGGGCIEVPAIYRVVMTDHLIDQIHGFVDAPERPRVLWSTGFGEGQPRCLSECKVVLKRRELIGSAEWYVGLIHEEGKTAQYVSLSTIGFRADGDSPSTLDHLRRIAESYTHQSNPEKCETPEDQSDGEWSFLTTR